MNKSPFQSFILAFLLAEWAVFSCFSTSFVLSAPSVSSMHFAALGNSADGSSAETNSSIPEPLGRKSVDTGNSAEGTSVPSDVSWVFIPVTSDGSPAGSNYYLPLDIFQQIYQEKDTTRKQVEERYFFHQANYSGALSNPLTSKELMLDSIHAKYEIEVLLPDTKIPFPFSAEQVYLIPGSTFLNGEPLQIFWENHLPFIQIAKPGWYHLEFKLLPIISPITELQVSSKGIAGGASYSSSHALNLRKNWENVQAFPTGLGMESGFRENFASTYEDSAKNSISDSGKISLKGFGSSDTLTPETVTEEVLQWKGIRFAIPPIANSQLKIQVPQSLNSIEFPSALGGQYLDQQTKTWHIQLGAAQNLAIQWKTSNAQAAQGILLADELYSWKINSKSRNLQCRFRFQKTEGEISQVEFLMDSRINFNPEDVQVFLWKKEDFVLHSSTVIDSRMANRKFIPMNGKVECLIREENGKKRVTLTLAKPVEDHLLVTFTIPAEADGSVGRYRLPYVKTEKTRVLRRWFQVLSEEYQLFLPENQILPQISSPDFVSVWDEFSPSLPFMQEQGTWVSEFVLDDSLQTSESQIWFVRSMPVPVISVVRENLSYAFDSELTKVHYAIHFPSAESIPALFHLKVPENLKIEKIVLSEKKSQKKLRFVRNHQTQAGIFYEKVPSDSAVSHLTGAKNALLPGNLRGTHTGKVKNAFSSLSSTKTERYAHSSRAADSASHGDSTDRHFAAAFRQTAEETALVSGDAGETTLPAPALSANSNDENGCRIELWGTLDLLMPASKEIHFAFPEIRILGSALHSTVRTVNLYRTSKVLISCKTQKISTDFADENSGISMHSTFPFENVRMIAGFSLSPKESLEGMVQVRLNEPKVSMNCRTILRMPKDSEMYRQNIQENQAQAQREQGNEVGDLPENEVLRNAVQEESVAAGTLASAADSFGSGVGKESALSLNPAQIWSSAKGQWQVDVEMLLNVEEGLADQIVLEIPAAITTPFVLEPPMPFELEPIHLNETALGEEKERETALLRTESESKGTGSGKSKRNSESSDGSLNGPKSQSEWVRLTIFPPKSLSGKTLIRLTGDLRENRLDASAQMSLVKLPEIRFPGIRVEEHDVVLPLLSSPNEESNYHWTVEGMLPVTVSKLFDSNTESQKRGSAAEGGNVLEDAKEETAGAEMNLGSQNPFLAEWKSEFPIQVFHVVEPRYTAQLQIQNQSFRNPLLFSVSNSIFWNSRKEFLGVSRMFLSPQNASSCILRIPRNLNLLEIHLDSLPIQTEEIYWNAEQREFQPLNKNTVPDAEFRFYRILLRTALLPQNLSVLFCGKAAECMEKPRSIWGQNPAEKHFKLNLPQLVRLGSSSFTPIKPKNSTVFFYLAEKGSLKLWGLRPLPEMANGLELPRKTEVNPGFSRKTETDEVLLASDGQEKRAAEGGAETVGGAAVEARSKPAESEIANAKNEKSALRHHGRTHGGKSFSAAQEAGPAEKELSMERVEISELPWTQVQILELERFLSVAKWVSALNLTSNEARDERLSWFGNWNAVRAGNVHLVQYTLENLDEPADSSVRQTIQKLDEEGTLIFSNRLTPEVMEGVELRERLDFLQKNSLWLCFTKNIFRQTAGFAAFDTQGDSVLCFTELEDRKLTLPAFFGPALFTLTFTCMILLGLYFHPSIPEEVRTCPFWLLCISYLWLICGLTFWVGFAILLLAVLVLAFRISKLIWQ